MQVPYYFIANFEALVMDIASKEKDKEKNLAKIYQKIKMIIKGFLAFYKPYKIFL
jgi:hypothetical protein